MRAPDTHGLATAHGTHQYGLLVDVLEKASLGSRIRLEGHPQPRQAITTSACRDSSPHCARPRLSPLSASFAEAPMQAGAFAWARRMPLLAP